MKCFAADLQAVHVEDAVLRLVLAADELVFFLNGRDTFDLRKDDEGLKRVMVALVANASDDGTLDAADELGLVSELFHGVHHLLDLLFCAANSQDDDHCLLLLSRAWRFHDNKKTASRFAGRFDLCGLGVNTAPADRG